MYQVHSGSPRYYFGLDQSSTRPRLGQVGRPSEFGNKIPIVEWPTEMKNRFEMSLNVSGVNPQDIAVVIHNNELVVEIEKEFDPNRVCHSNWDKKYGIFTRNFELPEGVDKDRVFFDVESDHLVIKLFKSGAVVHQDPQYKKSQIRGDLNAEMVP